MSLVNHEGIRALDDDELVRSLGEDAMPSEQFVAMQREYMRREIIRRLNNLYADLKELHKVTYVALKVEEGEEPDIMKLAPVSLAYEAIFAQVTVLQGAAAKT